MKKKLLSQRKRGRLLTSKCANLFVITALFTVCIFCLPVLAAGTDPLASAKSLLSKAATVGGGLWAVWGLVQLGINVKDHSGPGIQGAIWQILGGAIVIAAGAIISNLDISMTV